MRAATREIMITTMAKGRTRVSFCAVLGFVNERDRGMVMTFHCRGKRNQLRIGRVQNGEARASFMKWQSVATRPISGQVQDSCHSQQWRLNRREERERR